jgi:peroxiredoxin
MAEETPNTQKDSWRSIVLILLLLAGVGIITLLQFKDDTFNLSGKSRLGKGVQAPDFALPDIEDKMVRLTEYRGKVVLLHIWATWCPVCVEEMPSIRRLYQEMKGEDFEILAVSIDASGAEVVLPFMKKHRLNFTSLTDPKNAIKNIYQTTGVPESFIIDKNGRIAEKILGPRDWASPDIVRQLRDLTMKNYER